MKIQLRKLAGCDADAVNKTEGSIRFDRCCKVVSGSPESLARGMLPKGFPRNAVNYEKCDPQLAMVNGTTLRPCTCSCGWRLARRSQTPKQDESRTRTDAAHILLTAQQECLASPTGFEPVLPPVAAQIAAVIRHRFVAVIHACGAGGLIVGGIAVRKTIRHDQVDGDKRSGRTPRPLFDAPGVLVVDAQGHGIISAKIASTVQDTFHSFMLTELDR